MVAVALISALVVTVNASIEARRERDLAARRFEDVRHLANVFLFDVDAKISDIPGTTEARQLLVNTGLGYLDRLSEQAGGDASLLREIARGYDKLGDVQGSVRVSNLGQTEAALVSYQKASALRQRPAIAQSTDPAFLREAAHGEQGLSEALFRAGRMSEARDHAASAVDFLTRASAVATVPDQLDVQRERAEALIVYGFAIAVSGDMPAGLKPLRESVAFYEALPPKKLDDPQFGRGYAFALFRTMQILGELPDKKGAAEALELAPRVVAIDRKLLAGAPQQAGLRRGLARDLSKLGELLAMAGRHEEAVAALRESRHVSEEDVAADPHDQLARRNVAIVRVHESDSLRALGRLNEARTTIEPAVDDILRMLAEDGKNVTVGVNFVEASITYANVFAALAHEKRATQGAQLKRAIGLLDQAGEWLEPLKPKLVGSDAEMPGRIAAARRECAELLAHAI
jgi:tetratricopeptide (TPR) repeat protein